MFMILSINEPFEFRVGKAGGDTKLKLASLTSPIALNPPSKKLITAFIGQKTPRVSKAVLCVLSAHGSVG